MESVTSSLKFLPRNQWGMKIYFTKGGPVTEEGYGKYSIIKKDFERGDGELYYIRIHENGEWKYPTWSVGGFRTLNDATHWLNMHDYDNATSTSINRCEDSEASHKEDFIEAMNLLGFKHEFDNTWLFENDNLTARMMYYRDGVVQTYWTGSTHSRIKPSPPDTSDISKLVANFEKMLKKYGDTDLIEATFLPVDYRDKIEAAKSSRDLANLIQRTRSSNIWGFGFNVTDDTGEGSGDLVMQFREPNGGGGAIYQYFDVPIRLYRNLLRAPSKGAFFWKHIRNNFTYRKLTGDRKTKLAHGI